MHLHVLLKPAEAVFSWQKESSTKILPLYVCGYTTHAWPAPHLKLHKDSAKPMLVDLDRELAVLQETYRY